MHNYYKDVYKNLFNVNLSDIDLKKREDLTETLNHLILLLRELNFIKTVDINEGHHTLKDLYRDKRNIFGQICLINHDLSWRSTLDINGKTPSEDDDTFMMGIETELGHVCYILNKTYFNDFDIKILSRAPISREEATKDVIRKLCAIKIKHYQGY